MNGPLLSEHYFKKNHVPKYKHGVGDFKCEQCNQVYNNSMGLKRHTEVVHEGKEMFSCDR